MTNLLPTMDMTLVGASPSIQQMVKDLHSPDMISQKRELVRQVNLVTAFATADPVNMFNSDLMNEELKAKGEWASDWKKRPKYARTLVAQTLDYRLAGLSALPVKRSAPDYPDFDFSPLLKNYNIEQIQTLTEISGTVAVRPVYDHWTGQVFYRTYGAHQIYPYLGMSNDLLLGLTVTYQEGGIDVTELWTEEEFHVFRGKQLWKSGPNPYHEVPFSIYRVREHPQSWWGCSDLGVVTLNNIAVNKAWTDLLQLAKEQAFAIYIVYEDGDNENSDAASSEATTRADINWTSGKTVFINKGSKIETLSPDANIQAIGDTISQMSQRALDDAYVIGVEPSAAAESGYALLIKKSPYLNKMRSVRRVFAKSDQKTMQLAEMVRFAGENNLDSVVRNQDFRVKTEWDESPLLPSPQSERLEKLRFDLEIGAISKVDYIMAKEEVTREEAEAILQRVAEENRKFDSSPEAAA